MSVKIMAEVWEADLPRIKKLVALSLADHASHDGENIYPSIALTAWKTGLSNRTVYRVLQWLEKEKILERAGKHGSRPDRMTVRYRMNTDNLPKRPPFRSMVEQEQERGDSESPRDTERGDSLSSRGDTVSRRGDSLSSRGDTVSPDPSLTVKESSGTVNKGAFSEFPKTDNPNSISNTPSSRPQKQGNFGTDPAEGMLLAQARKASDESSFTLPETAGGADAYKDGPLTQWCHLIGRQRANLSTTEETAWARELRRIAEPKGANAEVLAWALRQWGRAIAAYAMNKGNGRRVWVPGNIAWMSPTPDTLFQYKDDPLRGISAFLAPLLEWGHEHGLSDIDLERGPQAQMAMEREEPPPRLEI